MVLLGDRGSAHADAEAVVEQLPATTAEQAVPWLIGVILLLAGMVIVLLALIFAGDASVGSQGPSPSESPVAGLPSASASVEPSLTPIPDASASAQASPTASPVPLPAYGALEMLYQGRSTALAPIYLLQDDFQTPEQAAVLAQDSGLDVRRFAWAPDGLAGAGLLAERLVSIELGAEKRSLGDDISTITFGDDGSTVYAVRVTPDGANDVATVLAIDYASGATRELSSASYARPAPAEQEPLADAQSADDGGPVRLYWLEGDILRLWVLGAGMWNVAPIDGVTTALDAEAIPPGLWAPDGKRHIGVALDGVTSTITVLDDSDNPILSTGIEGFVSHLRWSPGGQRVVFTLGTSAPNGGILQDLFLWDLNEQPPMKMTTTGANFGAEWRGSQPLWRE